MSISVLIADDEHPARYAMKKALARLDCRLLEAEEGAIALDTIRDELPDLVFLDLNMPELDGIGVLRALENKPFSGEIIIVTANDTLQAAVECIRLGASDYLTKPYQVERLRAIVQRNIKRVQTERQASELRWQLDCESACGALLGVSRPMRELFDRIRRAALAPLDILIRGETGTGKELIAREIHRLSERAEKPFVALNTAAVSESLAESQLFGHSKGAFTGASGNHRGVFEQADGGTLFLDEIGDMPLALQAKVLRVLQEREVQPLGSTRTLPVDVRIVCASHQDLPQAIRDGQFRDDLYYRIRGIELTAPPLRQRQEDIVLLADYFLQQLAEQSGGDPVRLSDPAIRCLLQYHWPGNVRELRQVVSAAGAMVSGSQILAEDLLLEEDSELAAVSTMPALDGLPLSEAKTRLVDWFERRTIEQTLAQTDGNVSAAARQLGIHRQSLQQKMAQLSIRRPAD